MGANHNTVFVVTEEPPGGRSQEIAVFVGEGVVVFLPPDRDRQTVWATSA